MIASESNNVDKSPRNIEKKGKVNKLSKLVELVKQVAQVFFPPPKVYPVITSSWLSNSHLITHH